jgi:hypothetical protein
MNADGSAVSGAAAGEEQPTGGGPFAEVLVLGIETPTEGPLLVRPVVDEIATDWVLPFERALALHGDDKIGVVSQDPLLAAKLVCDAAAWLADRGRPVTIIDASIESPVIAKPLSDDGDEGLVDVVEFNVSAGAVVRRTLATGVKLMTSGSYPLLAASVLESHGFARALDDIASSRGLVFVVLPAEFLPLASTPLTSVVAVGRSQDDLASLGHVVETSDPDGRMHGVAVLLAGAQRVSAPFGGSSGPSEMDEHDGTEAAPAAPADEGVESAERPDVAAGEGPDASDVDATVTTRAEPRQRRRPLPALRTAAAVVIIVAAALVVWRTAAIRRQEGAPTGEDRIAIAGDPGANRSVGAGETASDLETGEARREAVLTADAVPEGPGETPGVSVSAPALREPPRGRIAGTPGGPYVIFVSSHRLETAARNQIATLASSGVAATIARTDVEGRGTWFRVAVEGGYPKLAQAREDLAILHELGYEGAWIEWRKED